MKKIFILLLLTSTFIFSNELIVPENASFTELLFLWAEQSLGKIFFLFGIISSFIAFILYKKVIVFAIGTIITLITSGLIQIYIKNYPEESSFELFIIVLFSFNISLHLFYFILDKLDEKKKTERKNKEIII